MPAVKLVSRNEIFISVVIPVRNEARNIGILLQDLENQDYPANKFEVIVVDDHSTDETREIVMASRLKSVITIRLVEFKNTYPGQHSSKKAAITAGVDAASGELIVLTDGDSRLKTGWLTFIRNHFTAMDLKLVAGPVFVRSGRSFIGRIQSVEFASLIGSGAALFAWNYPTLCNGANLAFSRRTFLEVGGYSGNEGIISGDDEFLLKKIQKKYPGQAGFLKSREAIVLTPPAENIRNFIQQRKRWAGKWKKHGNSTNMYLALFIFFIHCGILAGFVLTLLGYIPVLNFAGLIFVKIFLEFILIRDIFNFAGMKMEPGPFITCSILYSFYAVIFGILANTGGYSWKGRKYKN
ncbi:MAG: glycosyltransferase [Cyclobacteriaceae bacterium]|nr:glycosyltransferase [Cyclobacteriaceae bacterium]